MPDKSRPKLPFQFKLYVWIYLFFIAFLPFLIVVGKADKYPWLLSFFWFTAGWPVIASVIYWYSSRRCSSQHLHYFDGLVYITLAMNIGWMPISLFLGYFGVLAAFLIAPFAALYGDYRMEQEFASKFFHKLVLKFYKGGLFTGERMRDKAADAKPKANLSKNDRVLKSIESPDGNERVYIVQRADNSYSYRRQWKEEGEWGTPGPYCGIYDSSETAENEARERVSWVKSKTVH